MRPVFLKKHPSFLAVLLAMAAWAVYLNALNNPFVYDDNRTILDNGSIRSLSDPRAIVLHEATRPVVNFSYAIDRALWGSTPFGFHLTNVLLHIVNVLLVFVLVQGLGTGGWGLGTGVGTRDQGPRTDQGPGTDLGPGTDQERGTRDQGLEIATAFITAALFAVHPMMTEAVGYISGRSDVLSGTFFLLAFLSARRWLVRGGAPWWVATLALWGAAL